MGKNFAERDAGRQPWWSLSKFISRAAAGPSIRFCFFSSNCHPDMMIVQNFHSVELLCQAMLTHLDLSFPDLDEEASPNYLRVAAAMDLLDMVLPVIGSLQVSTCSEYVHEGTLDWAQKKLVKSMF